MSRNMGFKNWFGSKEPAAPPEIGDLIVLERFEEAEVQLLAKIKENQRDTRSQMKLAEVYIGMKLREKAVDQYIVVADQWSLQGFHDRSIALLYKAMKLNPEDEVRSKLYRKIERLKQAKLLEISRNNAIDGIKSRERSGDRQATISALEVERLWFKIERCSLVRDLEPRVLKRLFAAMELVHLEEGETLVEAGQSSEKLYLIVDGVLEVTSSKSASPIRSFTSGDVIGDRALFQHLPWAATYRAGQRSSLLQLESGGVEAALKGNPDPRAFLGTMRGQGNDAEIVKLLQDLGETIA